MEFNINLNIRIIILGLLFCTSGVLSYKYETKYISVPVDHFSFANNNTFKMRYLYNDTFWNPATGPIFFYTGNEGDVVTFAENTGFMWDIAPEFNALVVFAEHRYYGVSMPYGNMSYDQKHLGYLTSSQTLADFVDLINFIQISNKQSKTATNPVIAFGGSYGGMLSAYIRMKYPFIVNGAIASSAPIFQFETPCNLFNRIVTSDFEVACTPDCAYNIRKSWAEIRNITANDTGKAWLSNEWKLCKPLKTHDDVETLIGWLTEVYGNLAMINYPYPANFLAPVPANPIRMFCMKLQNSTYSGQELLTALQKALSVYTNYTGSTDCIQINQTSDNIGDAGWDYQACTEMVMPMCSDGVQDMFEKSPWDYQKYSNDCFKKYGVRPQKDLVILEYGGKNIKDSTNIVFSNGLLDPWSSGGVMYNISKNIYAVLIPEGAHHLDLRASNPADPLSVIKARNFHKSTIKIWIKEHYATIRRF